MIEEENTHISAFLEGDLVAAGNERIMIVDDEYNVQRVVRVALEGLGYTVVTFKRASEAIDMLRKENDSVDLIITDKTMPEMMGFDLADEVIKIRPDIPIIMCTGFLDKNDSTKAEALGIKDIIVKPIKIRQLAYSVRKALESAMITDRT